MRKIVFAGDWTTEKTVGVNRFARQILLALDQQLQANSAPVEIQLLIPTNAIVSDKFQCIRVVRRGCIHSKIQRHFWQQVVFPTYVRSHHAIGVDLALALPVWGCDVCALHDCIMEAFPEGFQDHRLFRKMYLAKVRRSVGLSKRQIVTVSHTAKAELQRFYNLSDQRITVLGNGWEHMQQVDADPAIFQKLPGLRTGEYFFSLGSKYRHKNFEWVLKTAVKNPQHQFVVAGKDTYSTTGAALSNQKPENVYFTGHLYDGELKALMLGCRAFIQPSLYEGFGIPPLEALSLGKQIIVSNISCLPEIYRDTAYYIDPNGDGCDLDKLLCQQVSSPDTVLRTYTWANAATKLLQLLYRM